MMGDGYSDGVAVAHRFRSELRTRSAGALEDLNATDIRKLSRVIPEDRGLNPVDVVAEIKVNVGSKAGGGKAAARTQTIAVEGKDDVVSASEDIRAVNLELHLRVHPCIVAVAEANVNH